MTSSGCQLLMLIRSDRLRSSPQMPLRPNQYSAFKLWWQHVFFSILTLLFACPIWIIQCATRRNPIQKNTKVYLHWCSAKKYPNFTTFQVIGIQCPYHSNKGFSKFDTSYHCESDLVRKTSNSVKFTQAEVLYLVQLRSKTKSNQQVKNLLDSQAKHFFKYYLSIKNNYSI